MSTLTLTHQQDLVAHLPPDARVYLEGPAGCGKTTAGARRLISLIESGIPQDAILVFLPQRSLSGSYQAALAGAGLPPGGLTDILTLGGIARRMVELFWPLISAGAGFAHPDAPPTFLTIETAQYYLARIVQPLAERGMFDTVTIDRARLYTQILDNLNKAAVVGFPHTEISSRLSAALPGDPAQKHVYEDAQECANRFRDYCLAHNLLDFSLQLEVFLRNTWPLTACRRALQERYTHLIYDNVEEDTPVAHALVKEWLPAFSSALIVQDWDAGYRRFLGADPDDACRLKDDCSEQIIFTRSFVTPPALATLGQEIAHSLGRTIGQAASGETNPVVLREALGYKSCRFHPQMIDWLAGEIGRLVNELHVPPGEIAVLAPFMSDSLRFSLVNRLDAAGVPVRSHRPSRGLQEEPATRCLMTLAALAHPGWRILPSAEEVVYALMQAIEGLDLVRAHLLAGIVYRPQGKIPTLTSFDQIVPDTQERISFLFGQRYQALRDWILDYQAEAPLEPDHFASRLFGEVLSQPGFGFHQSFDAGEVTAALIESIRKFRWEVGPALGEDGKLLGPEYFQTVRAGLVAAQYVHRWQPDREDAVLLAPAYTFLMGNRPVDVQFWLDVGSQGWWQRLYQPLTQPYVLSRAWPQDAVWTDADEFETNQQALSQLCTGLIRRCRRKIYLGLSELGEQGFEQRGPLLNTIQRVLRRYPVAVEVVGV